MNFQRFDRWVSEFLVFLFQNARKANFVLFALFLASCFASSRLILKSDFSDLLPSHFASVKAVNSVSEKIGGAGVLMVGVESPDFEVNKKFVEAFVERIKPLEGSLVRSIDYRYADVEAFQKKFGLHYLSTPELKGLLQGRAPNIPKAFEDFTHFREHYLSADDGKILVVLLQPTGTGLGLEAGAELISKVKAIVADLNPKQMSSSLEVNLAGSIQSSVEEMSVIKKDMFGTALLLVSLLIGALFLFLWSTRSVVLLLTQLLYPVAWTFGLTQICIGYLNTQTAFLGSLVVGTGINYGIILISRYREFRQEGRDIRDSILRAVEATWLATLIASSTTAVGFLSLFLAENQGLAQFGFVGFVGVIFCWIGAFTVLPLWLYQWESKGAEKISEHPLAQYLENWATNFGNAVTKRFVFGAVAMLVFTVISIWGVSKLLKDPLEYNIHNLRTESATTTGTEAVERRLNKVFGDAETPSMVVFNHLEDAKSFCRIVNAKGMSESCLTAFDILPQERQDSPERKQILKMMHASANPPSLSDLPLSLRQRFQDKEGRIGFVGYLSPDRNQPLHIGANLLKYTEAYSNLEMPSGDKITAAGDWFILADLLRSLKKDGPVVAAVSFLLISLLGLWLVGSIRFGLVISFGLALATIWMLGGQGFSGIRYNFFNFIALPLTFGMGIDYPINIFIRARQEGFQNYGRVLVTSGVAVLLCSLTTIIGYYTLIDASNLALRSFAQLAVMGEFACLILALVGLPVVLRILGYWTERREDEVQKLKAVGR